MGVSVGALCTCLLETGRQPEASASTVDGQEEGRGSRKTGSFMPAFKGSILWVRGV